MKYFQVIASSKKQVLFAPEIFYYSSFNIDNYRVTFDVLNCLHRRLPYHSLAASCNAYSILYSL